MTATATYVLDTSDAELDRLLRAANVLAPIATSAFRQAGLTAGDKALDLGCGPLGALAALRAAVGEDGTVVGVDASPEALATAGRALAHLGINDVGLVQADINTVTGAQVGGTDFALAYCRLVLMHQPDPAATLAVIAGLLRPGGHVIAFDFFAPPRLEPRIEAVDKAWGLIIAAMRTRGASPDASRNYRRICDRAGFDVISERGTFLPMPVPAILTETTVLLTGARRGIEAAGLATSAQVDNLLAELATHASDGGQAWSPETIELIARKRD